MIFTEINLKGAYLVDLEPIMDQRGFFSISYCDNQFIDRDLETRYPFMFISFNKEIGTWRGLHYQSSPHQQIKLVRCIRGAVYDVIVDLRKESPTYCKSYGVTLSETNYRALYVPEDFAHGYLTLEPNSTVLYQASEGQHKQSERGIMWNDPSFDIELPMEPIIISDRDSNHPPYSK